MAELAGNCPSFEIRMAASRLLLEEFRPGGGQGGMSEKEKFVLELRREIERHSNDDDGDLALEPTRDGVALADPKEQTR
jgi:hypothetical protein